MKAERVAAYHGGSIAQALSDLFPEIGLEQQKLKRMCIYYLRVSTSAYQLQNYFVDGMQSEGVLLLEGSHSGMHPFLYFCP